MRHLLLLCVAISLQLSLSAQWSSSDRAQNSRAYLGVYMDQIDEEKAEVLGFNNRYGSYIRRVIPESASDKAGLQPFDYIYGIDDKRTDEDTDLSDLLSEYKAGDEAEVHFIRGKKAMSKKITFGARMAETYSADSGDRAFLGVTEHEDSEDEELGVAVHVVRSATAARLGLRDGDLITAINGYPLVDWSDLSTAIATLKTGDEVTIKFKRDGKEQEVKGEVGGRPDYSQQVRRERAFLGINSNSMYEEKAEALGLANAYGSYVSTVIPGTAAERAGLQPFDYIIGINDDRTNENTSLNDLLSYHQPDAEVTVHFIRQGKAQSAKVKLGRASDARKAELEPCQQPFFGVSADSDDEIGKGIMVSVTEGASAEKAGLQDGDVIMAINDHPIIDWQDITTAINTLKAGETIKVRYQRDGKTDEVQTAIGSECDRPRQEYAYSHDEAPSASRPPMPPSPEDRIDPVDMSLVQIKVADPVAEDLQSLRERGAAINNAGNLTVNNLKVTPDINAGFFHVEFDLPQSGATSVRVYNSRGRMLYSYDLGPFSGNFKDEVDLSQNGTGAYYLEIIQDDRSLCRKIVLEN